MRRLRRLLPRLGLSLLLGLLALEGVLRVLGWLPPPSHLEPDPALRWIPRAGWSGFGVTISPEGFRGPSLRKPGPSRVACLGDSCTFGPAGGKPYPEILGALLGSEFEVVNAGVPGYSTFQGLRWYRSRVEPLKPSVVTVYYGWNDHWENTDGRPDRVQVDTRNPIS